MHLWVHGQDVQFNGEPLIRYFGSPSLIHINGCQVKGVRPSLAPYLRGRFARWVTDFTSERHLNYPDLIGSQSRKNTVAGA